MRAETVGFEQAGNQSYLPSIDFDALAQYRDFAVWRQDERASRRHIDISPTAVGLDLALRLEQQGLLPDPARVSQQEWDACFDYDAKARDVAQVCKAQSIEYRRTERSQKIDEYIRHKKAHMREQGCIIEPVSPIYETVDSIATEIYNAEKSLLGKQDSQREQGLVGGEYIVTKRGVINAETIRGGNLIIIEGGFLIQLDKYLRENKGFTLSQDHIAAIIAHERSHSDPDATMSYLNEEYCDVQGLLLIAEAGYNPNAYLDITDFFIWLEDNESANSDSRQSINISSHPHPRNRRVVLVNRLKDPTSTIKNLTKSYSEVPAVQIDQVGEDVVEWERVAAERLLISSREEALTKIRDSGSMSELMDVMEGVNLLQKAELTKGFVEGNRPFLDKLILRRAVMLELIRLYDGRGNVPISINDVTPKYDESDHTIPEGRRSCYENAKNHALRIDTSMEKLFFSEFAQEGDVEGRVDSAFDSAITMLKSGMEDISPAIWSSLSTISEYEKSHTRKETDAYIASVMQRKEFLNEQIFRVWEIIDAFDDSFDLMDILSGSLGQYPELEVTLRELGIRDFKFFQDLIRSEYEDFVPSVGESFYVHDIQRSLMFSSKDEAKSMPLDRLVQRLRYRHALEIVNDMDLDLLPEIYSTYQQRVQELFIRDGLPQSDFDDIKPVFDYSLRRKPYKGRDLCFGIRTEMDVDQGFSRVVERVPSLTELPEAMEKLIISNTYGGTTLNAMRPSYLGPRSVFHHSQQQRAILKEAIDDIKLLAGLADVHKYRVGDKILDSGGEIPVKDFQDRVDMRKRTLSLISTASLPFSELFDPSRAVASRQTVVEGRDLLDEYLLFPGVETLRRCILSDLAESEVSKLITEELLKGRLTYEDLIRVVDHYSHERLLGMQVYDASVVARERQIYATVINALGALTTEPLFGIVSVSGYSRLHWFLLEQKKRIRAFDLELLKQGVGASIPMDDISSYNPYDGMSMQEGARHEFEFIYDFLCEGGLVHFSSYYDQSYNGFFNKEIDPITAQHLSSLAVRPNLIVEPDLGAEANLLWVLQLADIPLGELESHINALLAMHGTYYTSRERSKLLSMIEFKRFPNLLSIASGSAREIFTIEEDMRVAEDIRGELPVPICRYFDKRTNAERTFDLRIASDLVLVIEDVMELEGCFYKDYLIQVLVNASLAISSRYYKNDIGAQFSDTSTRQASQRDEPPRGFTFYYHPAIDHLGRLTVDLLTNHLSAHAYGYSSQLRSVFDVKIGFPSSERTLDEVAKQIILDQLPSSTFFNIAIGSEIGEEFAHQFSLRTPFSYRYRNLPELRAMNPADRERTILYERMQIVAQLPNTELRDALLAYSIITVFENMESFSPSDRVSISEEVRALIRGYRPLLVSSAVKGILATYIMKDDLGVEYDKEVALSDLQKRFLDRETFLEYVRELFPEKSLVRDRHIILAAHAYPLRLSEADAIRDLLYSTDYGTSDQQVALQRGVTEAIRSIKQIPEITERHIGRLVLWSMDEDLQIRTIDEFVRKISLTPEGRGMLYQALSQVRPDLFGQQQTGLVKRAIDVAVHVIPKLPLVVRKKVLQRLIDNLDETRMSRIDISSMFLSALPPELHDLKYIIAGSGQSRGLSINSLLDASHSDNPNSQAIFNEFMLGTKGLMEEPICRDVKEFRERYKNGFPASEMHAFVDDLLNMIEGKSNMGKDFLRPVRIIAHSYLEYLSPVERSVVLYKLFANLQKINLRMDDNERLRSQILSAALNSIHVVGAKIAQIDELMPPWFREDATVFKHSVPPISRLLAADVLLSDGLSDQYVIESEPSAASTASGVVLLDPKGDRVFGKIIRPEVSETWRDYIGALEYSLQALNQFSEYNIEIDLIIGQIRDLVALELDTQHERENIVRYREAGQSVQPGTQPEIPVVNIDIPIVTDTGDRILASELLSSRVLLQQYLEPDTWSILAQYERTPALYTQEQQLSIARSLWRDFRYRAFVVGTWHSDMHGGNIAIRRALIETVTQSPDPSSDLTLLDLGQIGCQLDPNKRIYMQMLFTGSALRDDHLLARAIYNARGPNSSITEEDVLGILKRGSGDERILQAMSKANVEEYMSNFFTAMIKILTYFRKLPLQEQLKELYDLLPQEEKGKVRYQLLKRVAHA